MITRKKAILAAILTFVVGASLTYYIDHTATNRYAMLVTLDQINPGKPVGLMPVGLNTNQIVVMTDNAQELKPDQYAVYRYAPDEMQNFLITSPLPVKGLTIRESATQTGITVNFK